MMVAGSLLKASRTVRSGRTAKPASRIGRRPMLAASRPMRGARAAARDLLDATDEGRPAFWAEIAELGWLGLHVGEQYGGAGFGLPELVVVVEEFGRAVAPGPFVPTVICSAVIAAAGNDDQRARFLPCRGSGCRRNSNRKRRQQSASRHDPPP